MRFPSKHPYGLASSPGSLGGREREPGNHCMRMRQPLSTKHGKRDTSVLLFTYCIRKLWIYECPCYFAMACASFDSSATDFTYCVSYALLRLKKEDLVLKPKQSAVLELIFQGKDVYVWFPTGYGIGKSVCYQALPFMFDHKLGRSVDRSVVLVVSPLVSPMIDRVTSLRSVGVGAAIMSAGQAGG